LLVASALCVLLLACAGGRTQPPDLVLERVHPSGAHFIAFDPDGARLASGGLHGDIHLWRVADGARLATLRPHRGAIRGLIWLDDLRLVSAGNDGVIRVNRLGQSQPLAIRQWMPVTAIAPGVDGASLLVAGRDRLLQLQLPSLQTQRDARMDTDIVSLASDPAHRRHALALADGRVLLLDANLNPLRELTRASRQPTALRFSAGGDMLLGGSWLRLLVWDLPSGALEERRTEHLGKLASVDVSPDGRYLMSLGRITDSAVRLVDRRSNAVVRRYHAHALCGRTVRFSPDGVHAASAAEDGSIHLYDLRSPYRPVAVYPQQD
jgi:WD40 repeat protein